MQHDTIGAMTRGVISTLIVRNGMQAIEFYKRAFGAQVVGEIMQDDSGRVMNAMLALNGGVLMVMDDMMGDGQFAGKQSGIVLQLLVEDGEVWWQRAVDAGCTVNAPFDQKFWGDRWGQLDDPFGIQWAIGQSSPENRRATIAALQALA